MDILYEDHDIVAVAKPAGMLSIPDRFDASKPSVARELEKTLGKLFVVHRLDRETSGILLFARHAEAHQSLSLQFESRQIEKKYLALVEGIIQENAGEIDQPIAPHPTISGKMMISAKGKPSRTTYSVLERFRHFTLIEAQIHTGRTHQIRIHLYYLHHPLAVDPLYGTRSRLFLSEIKLKKYKSGKFNEEEQPIMSRITLHAASLAFDHPVTGKKLKLAAEPPKDFRALLTQLRKWGSPT